MPRTSKDEFIFEALILRLAETADCPTEEKALMSCDGYDLDRCKQCWRDWAEEQWEEDRDLRLEAQSVAAEAERLMGPD